MSDEVGRAVQAASAPLETSGGTRGAAPAPGGTSPPEVPQPAVGMEPATKLPDAGVRPALGTPAGRAAPVAEAGQRPRRVRSQPLAVRPAAVSPGALAPERVASPQGAWRWTPVAAGLAVLAWVVAIGLLVTSSPLDGRVSSPRLLLAVAWGAAAMLTFAPVEFRLGLPGLTLQGILGWVLLGYILAFVPPPTGWLLELPDLPVYLLFFVALFFAIAAAALPLTYLLGRRMYVRRMHQLDLRRARRQAYEIGILAVALMLLAELRVLMPLTGLLVVAVFVLVETLLLSQVAPES